MFPEEEPGKVEIISPYGSGSCAKEVGPTKGPGGIDKTMHVPRFFRGVSEQVGNFLKPLERGEPIQTRIFQQSLKIDRK